jgi:hypothetical protein
MERALEAAEEVCGSPVRLPIWNGDSVASPELVIHLTEFWKSIPAYCYKVIGGPFTMKSCVLVTLLLIAEASAQITCPISITKINPRGNDSIGHGMLTALGTNRNAHENDGRMFVLKVRNVSTKDISGMTFQAYYFDAVADEHAIPVAWNWTDPLKAGAEKEFRWENLWLQEARVGWRVAPLKILFSDGEKWAAPSPGLCSAETRRVRK